MMQLRDWVRVWSRRWFGDSRLWELLAWAVLLLWSFLLILVCVIIAYAVIFALVNS
jgi:hypothetical protein